MKQEHINEIKGIIIWACGLILLVSFVSFVSQDLSWYHSTPNVPTKNLIRITGAYVAGSLFFVFGYSAYAIVLFLFVWGWRKFASKNQDSKLNVSISHVISFVVLFCVLSSLLSITGSQVSAWRFQRAGIIGFLIADFLVQYLGVVGSYIILLMLGALAFIITGEVLISPLFVRLIEYFQEVIILIKDKTRQAKEALCLSVRSKINIEQVSAVKTLKKNGKSKKRSSKDEEVAEDDKVNAKAKFKIAKPNINIIPTQVQEVESVEDEDEEIPGEYRIPAIDLLEDPPVILTDKIQDNLIHGAKLLEETLESFGVVARVADIERGPAITRYELEPGSGVKVQKFTTLCDDIALVMKVAAVRVVAPIPGKNRVGIEVPNGASAAVYLKDVLLSSEFRGAHSKLTMSLGKDVTGKAIVADLAQMPHLLIAGTTGSGKTVCVNGIIMSMLLNTSPDDVKFVMVDPKMVELAQYNDIPHLLCPTVTDPKKASAVLNWVVGEMESRYRKLSKVGARNIAGYNAKGNKMFYIVVIIDELADLMQVSAKAVEGAIARLAQLSRAVGIHLILATQRPSVDVITGVIKANFPARISFKVASKVDSRTVLDANGAQDLLGKGDMLFIQPGDAKPTRGQGNFVTDDEINRVVQFIKDQQAPSYDESVMKEQIKGSGSCGDTQKDEHYDDAVRLVIETNQASVSILQRRMRLGYTRAARLIDMMEQGGIVGPYCGSKPRDILIDREQWLLENMIDEDE